MSLPPGNPSAAPNNRWQFSLWGLLIFTVSVAIAAAVMREKAREIIGLSAPPAVQETAIQAPPPPSSIERFFSVAFCGMLLVILAFWMIVGILSQVRDLRSTLISHPDLCYEHRWGLRIEIFWRVIVAALMSLCILMALLINEKLIAFAMPKDILYQLIGLVAEAVPAILFLVVVGSVPCARRKESPSLLHRGLYAMFCVLAAGLCVEQCIDNTLIYNLVHIAIYGIDSAQPLQLSSVDPRHYRTYTNLLFWWSVSSGAVVIISWTIVVHLARQWSMGPMRRLMWIVLLALGIMEAGAFIFWVYAKGLKAISPCEAETLDGAPLDFWLSAAVLLLVVATVLTYRLAVERERTGDEPEIQWRRNPDKYAHEWRTVLSLLAVGVVFCYLDGLAIVRQAVLQIWLHFFPDPFPPAFVPWTDIFYGLLFFKPVHCLWCAVVLVALHRAVARRPDEKQLASDLPRTSPVKFAVIWLATAAVTVSGAVVLVWMSFGFWFNPWWRGR